MDATLEREIVQRTLTSFIYDHEAGRNPDPAIYTSRCPSEESRAELERGIQEYLDLNELLEAETSREGGPDGEHPAVNGGIEPRIGSYRVESELGRGGMAQVFEVWDHDLNRTIAMKVSRKARLNADGTVPPGQEGEIARFLQEAHVTSQLRHPGIVPVHQLGVDSRGHVYFTMQLIEEETLAQVFAKRKAAEGHEDEAWSGTRILNVLVKACDAVAFAHSQGVIHRDLKPANLMVGQFGEVYVLDWGLAKLVDERDVPSVGLFLRGLSGDDGKACSFVDEPWLQGSLDGDATLTRAGAVIGTPAYMSPEQAAERVEPRPGSQNGTGQERRRDVREATDIYALGAILYELLTGAPPYHHGLAEAERTFEHVLELLRKGPPAPLETRVQDVPAELCAICEKAMRRDVGERYASVLELRDDLQAFLDGHVVKAYATGAVAELRMWVRRNKLTALSALGVLVASAAAFFVWVHYRNVQFREERLRADRGELVRLTDEAESLWPIRPEQAAPLERWLSDAEELASRRDEHERWQEERGMRSDGEDYVSRLSGFLSTGGLVPQIERRLAAARTIEDSSVSGERARDLWDRARREVASHPSYGFELTPQIGLLPLGPDPSSGLQEFADLQTGEAPRRGADGRLRIGPETGVVFVLIPGGVDWIGAQSLDPAGNNYVPADDQSGAKAYSTEVLRQVEVEPFFLSKYEMTQGQWLRLTGDNPSQYRPGSLFEDHVSTLLHPVEMVGWQNCVEILGRPGFRLPSEAEWEYATRAGTDTPWYTGENKESLFGHANIADRTAEAAGVPTADTKDQPDFDDGYPWHGPVGSWEPNPFGLHDVHGNVFEWCAERWALPTNKSRIVGPPTRPIRGGSYANKADYQRSAYRIGAAQTARRPSVGVRPARSL